ncbi:hypothetical protein JCM10450v2_001825 [Rhodotorula kratochvilovae]
MPSSPTHEMREVFPSDEVAAQLSASPSSSPTSRSEGSPSPLSARSDPTRPRHHLRSSSLLEAAHIAPREATWQCLGEEAGGLQFADGAARSWEDEPVDYGVPCPSKNVREVLESTVHASPPSGVRPSRLPDGKPLVRKRTLQRDPDSPD